MKNLLIAFILSIFGAQLNAQTTPSASDLESEKMNKLATTPIDISIDSGVFTQISTNIYMSDDPKAFILAMLIPESYESSKEKIMQNKSDDFVIINRGEKQMNGVQVLFMEGTSESEGIKMDNKVYCIKYDDQTCMMVMGMIEQTADKKYFDMISNSMKSVVKAY